MSGYDVYPDVNQPQTLFNFLILDLFFPTILWKCKQNFTSDPVKRQTETERQRDKETKRGENITSLVDDDNNDNDQWRI